jgi:hypothetical protein
MFKTTLLFAIFGPLLGSFGLMLVTNTDRVTSFIDIPLRLFYAFAASLISYPFALLLGFVPAVLTGFVFACTIKYQLLPKPYSYLTNAMAGAVLGLIFTSAYELALHLHPGFWYSTTTESGVFSGAMLGVLNTPICPTHHSSGTPNGAP